MLPGASPERVDREAAKGKQSGRTQEIQRLIGRSLRAVTDLEAMGEVQITLDCDVLQADGGTRTAQHLRRLRRPARRVQPAGGGQAAWPPTRCGEACAAVSVGVVDGRRHARPRLQRGQPGRGRHERGDDRVRAGSSRCRARPRGCRSAAPSSTSCSTWRPAGSPPSSAASRRLLATAPPAVATPVIGRVRPGHRQPRQGPRDRRDPRRPGVELLPRPADGARRRGDR